MLFAVLFLVVALTASSAHGRKEYPCMVNGAECTGTGAQRVEVDGVSQCCPAHADISVSGNNCTCVEITQELPCISGDQQCSRVGANSFSSDSAGNVLCCPEGFMLTNIVSAGQAQRGCTCKRMSGSSSSSSLMSALLRTLKPNNWGSGGPVSVMAGSSSSSAGAAAGSGSGSATGGDMAAEWRQMGQEWRDFGRQFSSGFKDWGRNFGTSMRTTGLDLARDLSGVLRTALARSALPVQRAISDMIGNVFSAIPPGK